MLQSVTQVIAVCTPNSLGSAFEFLSNIKRWQQEWDLMKLSVCQQFVSDCSPSSVISQSSWHSDSIIKILSDYTAVLYFCWKLICLLFRQASHYWCWRNFFRSRCLWQNQGWSVISAVVHSPGLWRATNCEENKKGTCWTCKVRQKYLKLTGNAIVSAFCMV